MRTRPVALFLGIFGALVAAVVAIAARYGPTCELGEERCDGVAIERCVSRAGRRDTGRTWTELARCEGDGLRCEVRWERAVCVAASATSCADARCPEHTLCYSETTLEGDSRTVVACSPSW